MNIIKKFRIQENLSIRKLAALVGISPSYLSDIEKNKCTPASDTIKKLSIILNLNPEELSMQLGRIPQGHLSVLQSFLKSKPLDKQEMQEILNSCEDSHEW